MESKPTPGPWRYQEESDAYTHIVRGPNDEYVCGLSQDSSGLAEADARLIAQAPTLLASLKEILSEFRAYEPLSRFDLERIERADKAIAAAEGEPQP